MREMVKHIKFSDYNIDPNMPKDITKELQIIIDKMDDSEGVILEFSLGFYMLFPDHAKRVIYHISNTDELNPRRIGLLFKKKQKITIEGNGATLLCHSRMCPIVFDECTDINVRNLNIDWEHPLGIEAKVIAVQPKYIDLEIDPIQFPIKIIKGKMFSAISDPKDKDTTGYRPHRFIDRFIRKFTSDGKVWGVMEFDHETRTIPPGTGDKTLGWNWVGYHAEQLSESVIRMHKKFPNPPKVGNWLVLRHSPRDHAGIFIHLCKNVSLSNVNLYATAGLGIISQYSGNLSYKKVYIGPNREKRFIPSGHDDGFHCSNCYGQITLESCVCEGLMDDPVNVHGTSIKIVDILNANCVIAQFMHPQSIGLPWGKPEDLVGCIDHETLLTQDTRKIQKIEFLDIERIRIEFDHALPASTRVGDALENLTNTPNVLIQNCEFLSNRARGILISTPGKVIIRDNLFKSSGTAILIAGDANGWYESGAVKDVLIENNEFTDFCLANLYQFCEGIISIFPEIPKLRAGNYFHHNIRILNNKFHPFDYPVLFAKSTELLQFIGNCIERSHRFQPYHSSKSMIRAIACSKLLIKDNTFHGDVLGMNLKLELMKESSLIDCQKEIKLI